MIQTNLSHHVPERETGSGSLRLAGKNHPMIDTLAPFTGPVISTTYIDRYLKKIGFSGDLRPDLTTLIHLHESHTRVIPFENLNPLTGRPVNLDLDSIYQKLVLNRRGGYCFEHNILFSSILTAAGFQVKWLAARVMYNVPEGVTPPRGHMLLLVTAGGNSYVADVGFGGLTLPRPLMLVSNEDQHTGYETFRLLQSNEEWTIQASVKGEWKSLYRFTLTEQLLPDYEVVNYYLSTNPKSHFTFTLIAARMENGKRFNLRNLDMSIHEGGSTEKHAVQSAKELTSLLRDIFLIDVDDIGVDEIFGRLTKN